MVEISIPFTNSLFSSVARKRAITINSLFGLQLVSINADRNSRLLYTENVRFEFSTLLTAFDDLADFVVFAVFGLGVIVIECNSYYHLKQNINNIISPQADQNENNRWSDSSLLGFAIDGTLVFTLFWNVITRRDSSNDRHLVNSEIVVERMKSNKLSIFLVRNERTMRRRKETTKIEICNLIKKKTINSKIPPFQSSWAQIVEWIVRIEGIH